MLKRLLNFIPLVEMKKLKYKSPLNHGHQYWVPVVCKNKDYLVAYMMGTHNMLDALELDNNVSILGLDSSRFNDIIDSDGTRVADLTNAEIKELVAQKKEDMALALNHPENDVEMPSGFIHLHCNCGNYYCFKDSSEVPEEDFYCGLCDNVLIDYTGKFDSEYVYDG